MGSLFHDETVFDKITNLIPSLSPSSNDVRIDLRQFLFDNKYQRLAFESPGLLELGRYWSTLAVSFDSILPGNFFHHHQDTCRTLISQFMVSKPKDCLLDVYRRLNDALPPSDSAKEKKVLKVNAETIKSQIKSGFK